MRTGGLALVVVAALAMPAIADRKKASEHFALAESAERRKDWRAAIQQYELAYEAEPHPAMLYNMARNYERLSEPRNAAEHYRRYLDEGGDPADRPKVEQRIQELRDRTSTVNVVSAPAGAAVFIDDERVGDAPMELVLESGSHEAYVAHNGRTTGVKSFVLEYGEPQTLRFDLERKAGFLVIRSNVDGAEVMLNGEPIGRTPFSGPVPAGEHQLVITRAGYQSAQRELVVHAGGSEQITANLSKDPDAPPEPEPPTPPRWLFGIGYGYDGIDELTRFTLNGGIRSPGDRIEGALVLVVQGSSSGLGLESRLFFRTEGLRPYVRAAALAQKYTDGIDEQRYLVAEGGAGIMFGTQMSRYRYEYYLEVDAQAVLAGSLEDDMGETRRERFNVPISFGLIWSWGGAEPRQ